MSARKSRKTNSTQHNKKTESKATNALQKQNNNNNNNNNNNSQLTNSAVDVFTADMGKKMHYQLGICVGDCETQ